MAPCEWDKITERRGLEKQKAAWGEKLAEMKAIGIEYRPDWAAKARSCHRCTPTGCRDRPGISPSVQ